MPQPLMTSKLLSGKRFTAARNCDAEVLGRRDAEAISTTSQPTLC